MNEEESKHWVKNKTNQAKVVTSFFNRNEPRKNKIAFFMAGIPGAGKTEFAENARKAITGLTSIEHDQLVEYIDGYQPEAYYNYRKAGSVLVTRVFNECLQNGYSFIFDGTLSHENGAKNILRALKNDYKVIVVYVVQDANVAWELTQAREVVKKRAIERNGFVATCNKINKNLLNIFKQHKDDPRFSFWLLDKQGHREMEKATAILHGSDLNKSDEIEKALHKTYNV